MVFVSLIKMITTLISSRIYDSPWIISDTHDASKSITYSQNPNDSEAKTLLRRSSNEHKGLEFTYLFWVYVEDFTSTTSGNNSGWKHVLHKGSQSSYPNRAHY